MKQLLLCLLLTCFLASSASAVHPPRATARHHATGPKVYICGRGSAYAYHSSETCAGLSRCSHGVKAMTVAEAEGLNRRPCKKCY